MTACKAEKGRLKKLAASAQSPEAAQVHRDGIAELDAMLAACGLSSDPPKEPAASPLSASMLRDLGAASPIPSMGGTGAEALGSRMVLEPGRVLANRYEIQKRLGAGGMGAVFAAYDRSKQETIAIKVILPELVAKKEARERFLQEAKVATSLGHPGIVKVFDVQSDGELMFLTMELLEGLTLRQQMEERRRSGKVYSVDEVQRSVRTLAETLGYAHGKTVHRDVKPENVFVCADGRLVLMDFGLAKLLSASALSRSGTAMGTAYYMAPEQLTGASKVDHRADQFAVGVMAYELLTGKLPTGMVQPLRKVRKDVPAGFAAAVEKAMAQEPQDRHADMAALVAAMGKSVALPKVSGPVMLAAVGGLLLLVLGVVFGGDIAAAVKRWQRDPALVAAVDQQRQAVVAQFQKLEQFAKDLDQELPAEVRKVYDALLAAAAEATAAEDDAKAKAALTQAEQQLRRDRESLLQKVQGSLLSESDGLATKRDHLKDLGESFASAPQRFRQEAQRLSQTLNGSGKLDESARRQYESDRTKAERELEIAELVHALWSERAPDLLVELATKISAVKIAGSGKGDAVEGLAAWKRANSICAELDTLAKNAPVQARRRRVDLQAQCASEVAKLQEMEQAWFAGGLTNFRGEMARVRALDGERKQTGCSQDRLERIVAELVEARSKAEAAFVADATALARERLQSDLSSAQAIVKWLEKDLGTNAQVKSVAAAASAAAEAAAAERERLWRELKGAGFREAPGSMKDPSTGFPTRIEHVVTGAALALIPKGDFQMGSPLSEEARNDNEMQHPRAIRYAFYLGVTEVTQSQWEKLMGSNPSYYKGANLPVANVSWNDCQEYLEKVGGGLRLPSEAEWEYACRAGTTSAYWFGDRPAQGQGTGNYFGPATKRARGWDWEAWPFDDGYIDIAPVGSFCANPWGLHDMHGNLFEWCEDGYADYPATGTEEAARAAGARVLRGGSWGGGEYYCRAARRIRMPAEQFGNDIGFRLARTLPR